MSSHRCYAVHFGFSGVWVEKESKWYLYLISQLDFLVLQFHLLLLLFEYSWSVLTTELIYTLKVSKVYQALFLQLSIWYEGPWAARGMLFCAVSVTFKGMAPWWDSQAVPAGGSWRVPYTGVGFPMSCSMGDFPSQRAAFRFCCPDVLLSRVGGCSGKIYIN